MTNDIQEKRDGLQLQAALMDPEVLELVVRSFESRLAGYLEQLLQPNLGDADALAIRFKAIGVKEAITGMGGSVRSAEEAIRRTAHKAVRESLGQREPKPWS